MKMPLEAISSHRQPVKAAPPSVPSIRNDIVDAALVPRNAPPAEQAITFHASSFTPDPIYRAHYLAQPSNVPRIASLPQPGSQSGTPQVSNCIPSVLHAERPPSPTRSIFSRPASPDTTPFPPASSTSGCFRSSTLRRQETDQSSYSQATLPEPYLPAAQGLQDIQQASPFVLSSWKPLSVAPVRTKSQDARTLWLDLERALLGTPSVGSRATTPSKDRQNDDEQKDVPSVDVGGDETTYDFTQTMVASKPKSPQYQTLKSSLTRPPLVRTDRSEDRLDHHRALACSIIEKAQHSAAASGPMPSQPPVKPFQEAAPHNTSPAVKHVRIATEEEVIDEQKPRVTTSRPSKLPRLAARVKVASRIPVPTGTRAGVLQRRRPGIEL